MRGRETAEYLPTVCLDTSTTGTEEKPESMFSAA